MLLSKGKYTVSLLEQRHIDETAWLIARSFVKMNPIWAAFKVDLEEAFSFVRSKIIMCAILPISHIVMDENDKIIGCSIQTDIKLMQDQQSSTIRYKPKTKNKLFQFLADVEKELEKDIWSAIHEKGVTSYCLYAAVEESLVGQSISIFLLNAAFLNGRVAGMRNGYTRVTSPIILKYCLSIGSVISNKVTVSNKEIGLKNTDIYLLEMDFQKLGVNRALL
ncbi:hypothetical protein pb186bvf_009286 [Paramecium bursaria]